MSASELELDLAVGRAMAETLDPKWIKTRGIVTSGAERVKTRMPRWSEEEDQFLRDNLQNLTMDEIGEKLGRSGTAVKIRHVRKQMPSPSKMPGYLTGYQFGRLLGLDIHSVVLLFDRGLLQLNVLPNKRNTLQISREAALRWAVNPENWIYYKHTRVRDPHLKRLLALRRERWPDRWLRIGEAAKRLGTNTGVLNKRIQSGELPAKRWGNWWIKESALEKVRVITRKGRRAGDNLRFTPAADAFILKKVREGSTMISLGRLMKQPPELVRLRYFRLMKIMEADNEKDNYCQFRDYCGRCRWQSNAGTAKERGSI